MSILDRERIPGILCEISTSVLAPPLNGWTLPGPITSNIDMKVGGRGGGARGQGTFLLHLYTAFQDY